MNQNEPSEKESDIEEILFKIFGILLILVAIISFILAITGSNVFKEGTTSLEGGMSRSIGLNFDKGQTVYISYEIHKGVDALSVMVETESMLGGNIVDLENTGDNEFKFQTNETKMHYISFTNMGSEEVVFHFEIAIKGHNSNSQCYSVSIVALILGIIVLFPFYKDKII